MPKRSTPFQRLVLLFKDNFAETEVVVSESKELVDRLSGDRREVDITLESKISGSSITISVEVVERKRKADMVWVDSMLKKHESLPTNHLILISKNGFTKKAQKNAKLFGAEVLSVDQAKSVDWVNAVRLLEGGVFELTEFNYNVSALLGDETEFEPIALETVIELSQRPEPTTVKLMVDYFLSEPVIMDRIWNFLRDPGKDHFTLEYSDPREMKTNKGVPLHKLRLGLKIKCTKAPMEYMVGRIGNYDFVHGNSTDNKVPYTVAFFKDGEGKITGRLHDGTSPRSLSVGPNDINFES